MGMRAVGVQKGRVVGVGWQFPGVVEFVERAAEDQNAVVIPEHGDWGWAGADGTRRKLRGPSSWATHRPAGGVAGANHGGADSGGGDGVLAGGSLRQSGVEDMRVFRRVTICRPGEPHPLNVLA